MKTFLDRNGSVGKTFLMYGNMDDVYYHADLVPRNFEQMMVQYLKSRGYRHVIFFGEDGTKGAFCLDRTSANFFFHENRKSILGTGQPEVQKENNVQKIWRFE